MDESKRNRCPRDTVLCATTTFFSGPRIDTSQRGAGRWCTDIGQCAVPDQAGRGALGAGDQGWISKAGPDPPRSPGISYASVVNRFTFWRPA